MACEAMNGFEKDDATSIARQWTVNGTITVTADGRRSTNAVTILCTTNYMFRAVTSDATYHVGFAFRFNALPSGATNIAYKTDILGNNHLVMKLATTGALTVTGPSGAVIYTSTSVLLPDEWNYIEWSSTIDAAGSTAIYLNGSTTPDTAAYSGDTQTGSSLCEIIVLGSKTTVAGAGTCSYGDFYANSGTGAIAKDNTRWGDTKVVSYLPNAAGSTNGLVSITTGTAAATNYQEVDDATTDDDTTYVYGTAAQDTYNFPALGFTPLTIQAASVRVTAKKTDAGARTIAARCISGVTTSDATAVSLSTAYIVYEFIFPQDPNTSASWTQSGWEAAEFGPKVA